MRQSAVFANIAERLSGVRLSRQLMLLVLITALPLILASLFMFNRMAASEREGIRQGLMVSSRTLSGLVDNEIATHVAIAVTLAQSNALQKNDLSAFWLEAKQALEFVPGAWLGVSDPQARHVLNTLVQAGTPLPDHAITELVTKAFATRQPQVSDLVTDPVSQRLTTFVVVPVYRANMPLYALSIAMPPARFQGLINPLFTRGEVVAVLDMKKIFICRVPDPDTRLGTLASEGWRAAVARAAEGWVNNKTVEGYPSLTAYTTTTYGWIVGIARLESDIARPVSWILWTTALTGVALTALSVSLASLIASHVNSGVVSLAQAAQSIVESRLVAPPPAPFAEAKIIADALSAASLELNRRNDLLAKANSELETTVARRTSELVAEISRREETEVTLRQAQKMDSIGQLTGGIAHDFNNMLTIILGNLDTVQRRLLNLENAAVLARPIEAAVQGARSAARLTHRLLAFARQQPLQPDRVLLNTLVASLAEMLTRTVGEGVKIETVSGAGLWPTLVDANQMENTLVNLAVNARDAMSGSGKMSIETSNACLDEAYAARFADVKPGQYVLLSVSDTGIGIPPDKMLKVFEPFFTTKEANKGTGLGLATIHGFVKQSGGHVRIYSEVGSGTTVKIYLPRLLEAAEGVAAPQKAPEAETAVERARFGETILLVEDDPNVRDFAVGALEDLGYAVISASSGEEGLQAFAGAQRVDALFTDVVLGGSMTGRQLADKLHAQRPALPVLYTTGYTRNAIVHQGLLDAGVKLLNKPFTQRDLAVAIRTVLDADSLQRPGPHSG